MTPPLAITVGATVLDLVELQGPCVQVLSTASLGGVVWIRGDNGPLTPADGRAVAAWFESVAAYLEARNANHD